MNETIELATIGFAFVAVLGASVLALRWIARQRTLQAAERIARSLSTAEARHQMTGELWGRLERYKVSKVRAKLGASNALTEAAAALVQEYRMFRLERR